VETETITASTLIRKADGIVRCGPLLPGQRRVGIVVQNGIIKREVVKLFNDTVAQIYQRVHHTDIHEGNRDDVFLKLWIELYCDGFAAFRRITYSITGIYVTLLNMETQCRTDVNYNQLIGLVPHNTDELQLLRLFVEDIRLLEKGIAMDIPLLGGQVFVRGAISLITTDIPEGHYLCSHTGATGDPPCRQCSISRALLGQLQPPSCDYDPLERRDHIAAASRANDTGQYAKSHGINIEAVQNPLLDTTTLIPQICPYEPLHMIAGVVRLQILWLVTILSKDSRALLSALIKSVDRPGKRSWATKFHDLQYVKSSSYKELIRVGQILPLLLPYVLTRNAASIFIRGSIAKLQVQHVLKMYEIAD
jgi:hypothetical protein